MLNLPDVPAGVLTPAVQAAIIAREAAIVARVNAGTCDPIVWLPFTSTYAGRTATFYAMQTPLRIDGVIVGMSAYGLQQCCDLTGGVMHTPRSLDLTVAARGTIIDPQTMWDANRMLTNAWFVKHTLAIDAAIAAAGGARGLVQTVGKPFGLGKIIFTTRAGHAQNYGWHLRPGSTNPWRGVAAYASVSLPGILVLQQPGTEHDVRFQTDYASTGEWLRGDCSVDGQPMLTRDVMTSAELAGLISHEGALPGSRQPGVPQVGRSSGGGGNPIAPPFPPAPPTSAPPSSSASGITGTEIALTLFTVAAIAGVAIAVVHAKAERAGHAPPSTPLKASPRAAPTFALEARESGTSNVTSDTQTLAPNWQELRSFRGHYNKELRAAADGESGAYAFRERGADRHRDRVLYVGESHTGRLWKTMLRHMQPGTRATCRKRNTKRKGGCMLFADVREWTYAGNSKDIEVAIWICAADEALDLEGELIERLEPEHNEREHNERGGYEESQDEDEATAPF